VFAASVPEVFAGEVEERTLFDEVAGDLAFALHKIELSRRLADARRRHREIFEGSRDGFVMVDAAGRILDANRAYCALLGYTLTELRGLENVHVVTPARWHQWEAEEIWSRRLLKQGASGLFEKECLRKDGRIVPVEVQAYAVRDEAGRLDYVWSAVRDLSERQQREERIALLGRLLDEGPAAITIHDAGGRFLFANRQAVRLHGYDREAELLALSLDAVGVPGSGALPAGWKDRIAREGETRFEVAHHRRDGSTLPLEVLARPIEWQGRPALLSIAVDITERKQAETALRRRETLLQRIFEVLPVGLWLADQGGTILRGNPAGVRLWGAELQMPLAGWADFKAWRLPQREPVGAEDWALVRTIRDQVTVVDELLEIETADGRRKTILNYSAPVLDDRGTLEGAIMLNLDVTDRVTLEAQLRQAHKMESVGRLAGGVAHDFNNLVMGIQGYAELCRAGVAADHPVRPWIDEILREAKRSANLTRRLLAFARKQTIAPRVLDLNEAVEGMLRMLRRLIGEDVHLVWQPAANLWPVRVDPGQLDQILANLCVNARDAISGVGHITIETSNRTLDETCRAEHADARPGRFVVLTVSDDGCGMAPEVQAHLFEPFFTTKAVGEGTGLGLATVYGILQQNQGFVNVYTEPGRGTTFRIYLPRHEGGAESTSDSLPPGAVRGTGTILLVEDEAAIRITAAVFLQDAGFSVLTAEAPEVALSLSAGHAGRIDLLITDVVMPGMNGSDLARELRGGRPDLRVLYMSGYTANVIAHHGVLEEGVEFLEKPFSKDELIRKVAEVLRRDADRPGV
jgi:PAS domain S-box-containing protein